MIDRKKHIEEIIRGGQVFSRKSKVASPVKEDSLTPAQWLVAVYIAQHEGLTTNELAKAFGISGSAATQLVNALVKKSYVIRETHPADRRAYKLVLTAQNRKQLEERQQKQIEEVLKVFEVLTDEEFEVLAGLNKKIIDAMVRG